MTPTEKIEAARELGRKAGGSHDPAPRTPAQNRALLALIPGGDAIALMNAYTTAWDAARAPFIAIELAELAADGLPSLR